MSGLRVAVEDRKADAVAHLAVARSQNTGPAFWVTTKDKGGRCVRPLFLHEKSEYSVRAEGKIFQAVFLKRRTE